MTRKQQLGTLKKIGYDFSNKYHKSTISYDNALIKFKSSNLSVTQFCKQNKISMKWFLLYLKNHGISIKNKQNEAKFNEYIFDSIDTEAKAYWLGFIYADGYISSPRKSGKLEYKFEISLKGSDSLHLDKFNTFMGHLKNNVKIDTINCNGKICSRCRWYIANKHLWETLNSYGCTPKKSLTLEFPHESIFKSNDLIRHFIRGYFDGDGCISFNNKEHTKPAISILGTEKFLKRFVSYLPIPFPIRKEPKMTVWSGSCSNSRSLANLNFLYSNCSIYLDRKYQRYLNFCRLSEKSDKLLLGKIGEG